MTQGEQFAPAGPQVDHTRAVAIVGARTSHAHDGMIITEALSQFDPQHTIIIAGGILGIEALGARIASDMGFHVHTILPGMSAARIVDTEWEMYATTYEQLPITTGIRDRSVHILSRLKRLNNGELLLFPAYPRGHDHSKKSGTWKMLDMVRAFPTIDTQVVILNDQ